ncbi:MAG TPA: hypothetical protein V6C90_25990 [Coleofasciculaceae cyanobacterium]
MAIISTTLLNRPSDRVIWQSCQPESVKYDFYHYCLKQAIASFVALTLA